MSLNPQSAAFTRWRCPSVRLFVCHQRVLMATRAYHIGNSSRTDLLVGETNVRQPKTLTRRTVKQNVFTYRSLLHIGTSAGSSPRANRKFQMNTWWPTATGAADYSLYQLSIKQLTRPASGHGAKTYCG